MTNKQQGFTLVELLVSLALFAIIVPSLAIGISNLTQTNYRARDLTLVSIIAENKAESLRSLGYNSIAVGTTNFSSELPQELNGPKSASYTVTQNSGYKTIDISIQYTDYKNSKTINYKTVVGETGVTQ